MAETKLSTRPWGSISEANYRDAEHFCSACLIDMNPAGQPKKKSLCKLPVREPGGAYNRNALVAAALALTVGHRGRRVQAPPDARRKAIRKLMALFRRFKMDTLGTYTMLRRALKRLG